MFYRSAADSQPLAIIKKVNCFSDLGRTLDLPVEAAQRNGAFVADSQPGDLFKQFFAFAAIF